ncbi:uncharacterized protein LOC107270109 isoform X2 [Cephus cinctus]|nr:uncharacterized protein LOC107270109 isoform X2 [Cephus cinctus]
MTEDLWKLTNKDVILVDTNWTDSAMKMLKNFETDLLKKMKKEGWDGSEDTDNIQWTFTGALFYSIIVITTIGYGHIAPKTQSGKVVTIFYAILGIPLMLLCLSNIGDIMASSFRFLYWKVCCYVCTKPPRRRRPRNTRGYSVRQVGRYSNRNPSLRRSVRASQRSADSALGLSESMTRSSYSDTECRYHNPEGPEVYRRSEASGVRPSTMSRYSDIPVASPRVKGGRMTTGTASLDRKLIVTPTEANKFPVLFNKYALDPEDEPKTESSRGTNEPVEAARDVERGRSLGRNTDTGPGAASRVSGLGTRSLPRHLSVVNPPGNHHHRQRSQPPPEIREPVLVEMESMKRPSRMRRAQSYYGKADSMRSGPALPLAVPGRPYRREAPSPRVMSPMGFAVHRQIYEDDFDIDYYDYYVEDNERAIAQRIKPVPIWLCVFLVVSYIFGGAFLFSEWEDWNFLDSAYFCFITLTTIGFGDFVPAHRLHAEKSIALCSLYLLFGIALLAMSFNLVQEEVINNVKSVAKRLGIIKNNDDDDEDEED